jgi:c-di-GMP-binding flagellar brake protein YcgR
MLTRENKMADTKGTLYIEKRKHRRVFKQYDVRYKLMPKDVTAQNAKLNGKSQDISVGGIRIEGEVIGNEGDIIRLELDTGKTDHIVVFAEIRWIRRENDGEGQLGLQFLALKEEDIEVIKQIISENKEE